MNRQTRIRGKRLLSIATLLVAGPIILGACEESVTAPPSRIVVPEARPPSIELTGNVEVSLTLTATDPGWKAFPLHGIAVLLDGERRQPLGLGESYTFVRVSAGLHTVEITGVGRGFEVVGGSSRRIIVRDKETAHVSFEVTYTGELPDLPTE